MQELMIFAYEMVSLFPKCSLATLITKANLMNERVVLILVR